MGVDTDTQEVDLLVPVCDRVWDDSVPGLSLPRFLSTLA